VNAIKNAATSKRFTFRELPRHGRESEEIDWDNALVDLETFRDWLRSRNFNDKFFLVNSDNSDRLSDPLSAYYAPKLAAAVRAWNEVTSDPAALSRETPKKGTRNLASKTRE